MGRGGVPRHPAEVFGHPVDSETTEAMLSRGSHWCPFLDQQCKKQSRLIDYPMGVCSVEYEGDVVGVFPGDHQFSPTEKAKFIIIKIRGMSPAQVQERLDARVSDPKSENIKKFATSIAGLSEQDKATLSDEEATVLQKSAVLGKVKDNSSTAVVVGP